MGRYPRSHPLPTRLMQSGILGDKGNARPLGSGLGDEPENPQQGGKESSQEATLGLERPSNSCAAPWGCYEQKAHRKVIFSVPKGGKQRECANHRCKLIMARKWGEPGMYLLLHA